MQIDRARATRPAWVALVGPGGIVGETALLSCRSPRSWSEVAPAPSRVAEVRVDELAPAERESLFQAGIEALAARVREQEDRATYLRSVSASHRVAQQASVRTRRRGELADRLLVLAEGQWSPRAQSTRGAV